MIIEGNKIIKEEIAVNPAKRNFILHNYDMTLRNRTAERTGRPKVCGRQIWQSYYLGVLSDSPA